MIDNLVIEELNKMKSMMGLSSIAIITEETTVNPSSQGTEKPEIVISIGCKDDVALDGSTLRLPSYISEEKIKRANCSYDKNQFLLGKKACTAWEISGWEVSPFKNYEDCYNKYFDVYSKTLCKVGSVLSFEFDGKIYKPCIIYNTIETKNGKQVKVLLPPEQLQISVYWGFNESEWNNLTNCAIGGIPWVCPEAKPKKQKTNNTSTYTLPDDDKKKDDTESVVNQNNLINPKKIPQSNILYDAKGKQVVIQMGL